MATTKTCTFCDEPASDYTDPPTCAVHEDLVLLVERLETEGQPLTLERVTARLKLSLANCKPGAWTITVADLPQLLPAFLKKRSEVNQNG
jgi:hypothetical protein